MLHQTAYFTQPQTHKMLLSDYISTITFAQVVKHNWQQGGFKWLDLTAANQDLQHQQLSDVSALDTYIFKNLLENSTLIGVGGYAENRVLYAQREHFNATDEPRTIHLGIDVWTAAGTQVHAPLSGKIHSFAFNDNFGDYGPTIILEHLVDGLHFQTLYGHLSLDSIENLAVGQAIEKGQAFAKIGAAPENGNWPPHLHFQVIDDLQGFEGDYPGVCKSSEQEFYLQNCPDPNLILRIPK